jgi:hypothetical protein
VRCALPFALAALALSLSGCSGITVETDYDPAAVPSLQRYETYAWLPDPTGGDRRVQNEILAERVRAAVDAELARKGFTLATGGTPHFLIGWFVSLDGRMNVSQLNSYYGYGWGPWYGAAYGETHVRYYEEGALVLDVVDVRSNQLAWRGAAQTEVDRTRPEAEREELLNNAVKRVLERFPPQY